jgi:hypothetical protein
MLKRKKTMYQVAAFCLFMRTSPINFGLLGGNGNMYIEMEKTGKQNSKQISIATVLDLKLPYAIFLAPLISHYRLPLSGLDC